VEQKTVPVRPRRGRLWPPPPRFFTCPPSQTLCASNALTFSHWWGRMFDRWPVWVAKKRFTPIALSQTPLIAMGRARHHIMCALMVRIEWAHIHHSRMPHVRLAGCGSFFDFCNKTTKLCTPPNAHAASEIIRCRLIRCAMERGCYTCNNIGRRRPGVRAAQPRRWVKITLM